MNFFKKVSEFKFIVPSLLIGIIIISSFFTLVLRGQVNPETYKVLEGVNNIERIYTLSIPTDSPTFGWSENFSSANLSAWGMYSINSEGNISVKDNNLIITANFSKRGVNEAIIAYRNIFVNINEYPIFKIHINAPQQLNYHIRFKGINEIGEIFDIWWETSPLDDLRGKGKYEEIITNIKSFTKLVIPTENNITLSEINIIFDDTKESDEIGEVILRLNEYSFEKEKIIIRQIENEKSISTMNFNISSNQFQAIIIKLNNKTMLKSPWNLYRILLHYEINGSHGLSYGVYSMIKNSEVNKISKGNTYEIGKNAISEDYYRIDTHKSESWFSNEIINLIKNNIDGKLMVSFIQDNFTSSIGFNELRIKSIKFFYSTEELKSSILINRNVANSLFLLYIFLIVVLPMISITNILIYTKRFIYSKNIFIFFALIGLIIRFGVSFFTGHSYDMEVWIYHARSYYESGVLTLGEFPSFPFFYYILLISYFPYAFLSFFNINDQVFLAHSARMLESFFIKLPFIFSDLVSFVLIIKIINHSRKIENNESIMFATLYFLSPFTIFISSVWGMYDSLAVAFFIAGIYYGLIKDNYYFGAIAFSLSGFTKGFGFIGLLPLFLKIIRKINKKTLLFSLIIPLSLGFLLYFPIILMKGSNGIISIFQREFIGRGGFGSDLQIGGFHKQFYGDISKYIYPYILIISILLITVSFIIKFLKYKHNEPIDMIKYFGMIFIIFYLMFWRVHPQYYLWILPVLILTSFYDRTSGLISINVILSLVLVLLFPPYTSTFGYFLLGIPYKIINLFTSRNAIIINSLIFYLIIIALIYFIRPITKNFSLEKELFEFSVILIQSWSIFMVLYLQYNYPKILLLPVSSIITLIIFLSPTSLSSIIFYTIKLRKKIKVWFRI